MRARVLILLTLLLLPLSILAASITLTVYDGAGKAAGTSSATLSCSASGNPAISTSVAVDAGTCRARCPSGEGTWNAKGTFSGGYVCNGKTIGGNTPVSAGPVQFNPGPGWDDYCDCTNPGTPSIGSDTAWHRDTFNAPVSYADNNRVYQVLYGVGLASSTVTPSKAKNCASTTSASCTASIPVSIPNPCNVEGKDTCKLVTRAKDFWLRTSTSTDTEYYNVDLSQPVSTFTWAPPVYTDKRGDWYNASTGATYTITCEDTYSGCDYIHTEDRYASCTNANYRRDNVDTTGTKYGGGSASISHTITNCNEQRCDRVVCYQSDDNAVSAPGNMEPLHQSAPILLDALPPESSILSSIQGGSSGTCGDGICSKPGEDATSCPQDCALTQGSAPAPGTNCGNSICETGETPSNCAEDCGYCGDGICTSAIGEDVYTCSQDCHAVCGNGVKEPGEVCDDGSQNGVPCTPGYNEACTYCSSTCDQLITVQGPYCGDGTCQTAYETSTSCPSDCGSLGGGIGSGGYCGDGVCEASEVGWCIEDCGGSSGSDGGGSSGYCGDGVCDPGEDVSCPQDCSFDSDGGGFELPPDQNTGSGSSSSGGSSGGGGICPSLYVTESGETRFAGSVLKGAFLKQLESTDYHHITDTPGRVERITLTEPRALGEKGYIKQVTVYALPRGADEYARFTIQGEAFAFPRKGITLHGEEQREGRFTSTRSVTLTSKEWSVLEITTKLDETVRERVFEHLRNQLLSPNAYAFEPLIPARSIERLAQPFTLRITLDGKPITAPLVERVSEGEPLYLAIPPGTHKVSITRDTRYYPTLTLTHYAPARRVTPRILTTSTPDREAWIITPDKNLTLSIPPVKEEASIALSITGYYHYGEYDLEHGKAYTTDTHALTSLFTLLSKANLPAEALGSLYLEVTGE